MLALATSALTIRCARRPPAPAIAPRLGVLQTEVFARSCAFSQCHSAQARKGDLDLSTYDATAGSLTERAPSNEVAGRKGLRVVSPGQPENSFLYRKLVAPGDGEGALMPRRAGKLEQYKIDAVREWIMLGANRD